MSARDDYPFLANLAGVGNICGVPHQTAPGKETAAALDEIDRLRAENDQVNVQATIYANEIARLDSEAAARCDLCYDDGYQNGQADALRKTARYPFEDPTVEAADR